MTAKSPWESGAGPWVAYRDEPNRQGTANRRVYLNTVSAVYVGSTLTRADAIRFDTKAEALAAASQAWPMRVAGVVKGAERVDPPNA